VARLRFDAIGVPWEIETAEPLDAETAAAVRARIEAYDLAWSRFRPDSIVARIAAGETGLELPAAEREPLFALYAALGEATGGRMSPNAGRALARLGYGGPGLDVGAAGKGQLVDLVAAVLADRGIAAWTVDASGDLRHRGRPIRVALEHPWDASLAVGVVELADGAICASATNRRRWVDPEGNAVHHVVDALTGAPVEGIVASWVVAGGAMTADGVATALFFTDRIPAALGAEWVRMDASGRIERSSGFPGEVFA